MGVQHQELQNAGLRELCKLKLGQSGVLITGSVNFVEGNYIGTKVEVRGGDGLSWQAARYPLAETFQLLEDEIAVFSGDVDIHVPVEVAPDTAPGPREANAFIRYQACTDTNCLFPVTHTVRVALDVDRP